MLIGAFKAFINISLLKKPTKFELINKNYFN